MVKFMLLLCFIPLAFAGMDSMESYDDYKMEGYDAYDKDKDDDKPCTKDHDHSDDYGYRAKMMAYFKMMMMNKFHEKMHEKMDEKKEEDERWQKFQKWFSYLKEMKEKKEKYEKIKMMMMWHQKMELEKKKKALEEFEELVKSFQEKKHKFVFGLTFEFLKLCKCGEISAKMNKIFTVGHTPNDFMDNMGEMKAMDAMESGDLKVLAEIVKTMTSEQNKKLFFAGLIKSMCSGAKGFIMYSQTFGQQMNMGNSTMTSDSDSETDPGPEK